MLKHSQHSSIREPIIDNEMERWIRESSHEYIEERFDRIPELALRYLYDSIRFLEINRKVLEQREHSSIIKTNSYDSFRSIDRRNCCPIKFNVSTRALFSLSLSLSNSVSKEIIQIFDTKTLSARSKQAKAGDTRDSRVYLPRISRTSVRDTRLAVTVSLSIKLIGMYNAHLNSTQPICHAA